MGLLSWTLLAPVSDTSRPFVARETISFLALDLLLAVVIAAFAYVQLTRTRRVEQLVLDRTAELEDEVRTRTTISRQLLRSQELLAAAQAVAHVGSWQWDIATGDVIYSDEVCQLLARTPKDLGNHYTEALTFVHPDDRELLTTALRQVRDGAVEPGTDYRILLPDGTIRWAHQAAKLTRDDAGQPAFVIGTVHDITDRVEAQHRIEQNEGQLRAILDSTRMGISLIGPKREVLHRNRSFAEILGYTQEELGDRPFQDLITKRSAAAGTQGFDSLDQGDTRLASGPLQAIHKDGHLVDVDVNLSPLLINGSPTGYVMDMRDITAELRQQRALKESEARFRSIIESSAGGLLLLDHAGKAQTANPAFAEMFGIDQEAARRGDIHKLFEPEDMALIQNRHDARLRGEAVENDLPVTITRQNDGTRRHVTIRTRPFLVDGQIQGLVSQFTDVTPLRESRLALERSLERLEQAQRIAHVGHWEWDITANEVRWSDEISQIFGLSQDTAAARFPGFQERLHPDDRDLANETVARALTGEEDYRVELRIVRPDGAVRIVSESGVVTFDEDGNPVHMLGTTHDITDRVEAERALSYGAQRLEQAQRIARVGHWEWDIVTNDLTWSDEIYRIFGLQPREFKATYPAFLEHIHPDDRQAVEAAVGRAVAGEEDYAVDHRIVHPDGTIRFVHESGLITWSQDRQPLRMLGVVNDITDRVEAERALNEKNAYLSTVVNTMQGALLITDNDSNIVLANQAASDMLGYSPEELARIDPGRLTHPDDQARILERRHERAQGRESEPNFRRRMIRKDGTTVWVESSPSTLWVNGEVAGLVAEYRDITHQLEAERQIRDGADRLELAQSMAHVGSWGQSLTNKHDHYWSDELYRLYGLQPGAVPYSPSLYLNYLHPDDHDYFEERFGDFRRGLVDAYEAQARFVGADGVERVLLLHGERTRDEDGNPLRIEGTA